MNDGGDIVKRKIRERTIFVPKEENFGCKKCHVEGDCANNKKEAMNSILKEKKYPFYWDGNAGEHGKIVCLKCGHWFTCGVGWYRTSDRTLA